jgi:hypothetical protein
MAKTLKVNIDSRIPAREIMIERQKILGRSDSVFRYGQGLEVKGLLKVGFARCICDQTKQCA